MTTATNRFFYFIAFLSVFVLFSYSQPVHAMDSRDTTVRIFDINKDAHKTDKEHVSTIKSFGTDGAAGVATCDLYGDSRDEIVVGSGPDQAPVVKILEHKGNKWKVAKRFIPYESSVTAGVSVACGDVLGDGSAQIVTAPGLHAGPNVKVFNNQGTELASFFAFEKEFHGGVNVAVGTFDPTQKARIVAVSGRGESTRVRTFRLKKNHKAVRELQLRPFASAYYGGGYVATGDVNGDGSDEIIVSVAGFESATIKVYKANKKKTVVSEFTPYSDTFKGGVTVTAADVNFDGKEEIITAPAQRGGPDVRIYTARGQRIGKNFNAYGKGFRGGTMLAASNTLDSDGTVELVTVPRKNTITGRVDWQKYIEVNLTTQTLKAWENGVVTNEFLISSGLSPHDTPTGEFNIMRHIYIMTYSWPYAPGNPANEYDIPNVHYNMEFTPYTYFHEAYWHNNFGNPMSHGCVNISLENSQWLYNWANDGDNVWVHY